MYLYLSPLPQPTHRPPSHTLSQATGYGGTVSQTHNIEAKLKAREDRPNPSQEERAKQREVRGGRPARGGGGHTTVE